ncbi:hypothetical protein [Butyricimonas paravirosa]|mgnify:FL=1|uniref:hypothetical protein n=1 Tax=Butyricimonas paravirosa TaxID=1472417 RepID=UPI002A835BFD|nr:hypothetical protein [Butyricimonas paravirosa]
MGIKKYVKPKFVDKILAEEAEVIKGLQMEAADDWGLNDDSGELRKSLRGHFSVTQLGEGTRLTMRYVKYLRFIDMPWVATRKKGLHLYNRIVFGRVYNDTYLRLKLAYREAFNEQAISMIKESMDQLNNK